MRPRAPVYECYVTTQARLNGYSLVTYEANRYSVSVNRARRDVIRSCFQRWSNWEHIGLA